MRVPDTGPARAKGNGKGGLNFSTAASHAIKIAGRVDVASWGGRSAPERRWLVDGLLPEGNVTLLAGDGGLGKSILALQAQSACALGKPWLGRPARACRSIGVYCEDDDDEIWRRLEAVAKSYGATAADLAEHVEIFGRVGLDNLLMTWPDQYGQGETTGLYDQIHNLAVDFGAELVVWDSLHDVFGGNENNRGHARQFIGCARVIAAHIHGAVLLTAHPSLSGRNTGTGEAGSTAWNNAVRSRLYLTAPKAENGQDDDGPTEFRELVTKKLNYGPPGGRIRLRWESGAFVPDEEPGAGTGVVASIERRTVETAFLEALDAIIRQGRWVSASPASPDYAPRIFTRMPEARAYKRPELERAMQVLFSSNRIQTGEVGKLSNRMPRMGIVRTEQGGNHATE